MTWNAWNEWIHMEKWNKWHEGINMNEVTWTDWNKGLEMKELKWMTWIERIERNRLNWMNATNELKGKNWNRGLEMNEVKWINWHEGLEMNDLKWMNWNDLKWMTWNEWIEMIWNEWIERNELPKVVRTRHFSGDFDGKRRSRYSLLHILSATLLDRAAKPRKHRRSSGDHGRPFYPKKHGFVPESVFKREFTRSRSLTLPNYLMMIWLTWWWDS